MCMNGMSNSIPAPKNEAFRQIEKGHFDAAIKDWQAKAEEDSEFEEVDRAIDCIVGVMHLQDGAPRQLREEIEGILRTSLDTLELMDGDQEVQEHWEDAWSQIAEVQAAFVAKSQQ